MNDADVARAVAADLGADVLRATETEIAGGGPDKRLTGLSEAIMVAGFVVSCAQLVVQFWQAKRDRAALLVELTNKENVDERLATGLDPEKKFGIIGRVVNRALPNSGASPSLDLDNRITKQKWVSDWLGYQERSLTPPVLQPFGDMRFYIVREDIYWARPGMASRSLPESIKVPALFVTDLATVPEYFWWALPPSGKYGPAAIIHDWLYWDQSISRERSDDVFDAIMMEMGVDPWLRKVMWAAVRIFGGTYWSESIIDRSKGNGRVLKAAPESAAVTWEEWRNRGDVLAPEGRM